eukprot:scaffold31746_cov20-Tisochrysis_lutea.AAC.1
MNAQACAGGKSDELTGALSPWDAETETALTMGLQAVSHSPLQFDNSSNEITGALLMHGMSGKACLSKKLPCQDGLH